MPDYTYHPALKPLLFRMPVEESRRLTLRLLEIQSRSAIGRRIFRFFGHGLPPEKLRVRVFGIDFPGPLGLGPGVDIDGSALQVMQYLGFGFLTLGPAGADAVPRRYSADPLRILETHTLVQSMLASAPGTAQLADRIERATDLKIPAGIALRGEHLETAIQNARNRAAFFSLPPECSENPAAMRELRGTTTRPLLLRLSPDWTDAQADAAVDAALAAGWNGGVATTGARTPLLPDGEKDGPFLTRRSLALCERVARRHGDAFPLIGAGGIMSPDDALSMYDAGAKLVELYAGFIYAGPGLPGRIVHALEARIDRPGWGRHSCLPAGPPADRNVCATNQTASAPRHPLTPEAQTAAPLGPLPGGEGKRTLAQTVRDGLGWMLVAFTGVVLFLSGIFALILAATVKLLPYDVAYLGMTMKDLCDRNECRIVHFMAHDRVSFGGSIMSIGAVYVWMAAAPLRRGEAWAWWAMLLSALVGFASFLTYLGYGYLDLWHGRATLALLPFFILGMMLSYIRLRGPKGPGTLLRPGARAWLYSPAGMGRLLMLFAASGMILGGASIMCVGMTSIFVPQDLEYMKITVDELNAINPRLGPLIAHDRAGFGGGLCSGGLAIFFSAWCGLKPGARSLWKTFLASGLIGFGTAIGIHPIVGYTSFIHLLPAYIGALGFLAGIYLLWKPVCRADGDAEAFPEL